MNYKHRKIIEIAQEFGYTTAKDFAIFLKRYKSSIQTYTNGQSMLQLSLF